MFTVAVLATLLWADEEGCRRPSGGRHENGPGMMQRMEAIDTNDDGFISDDEATD